MLQLTLEKDVHSESDLEFRPAQCGKDIHIKGGFLATSQRRPVCRIFGDIVVRPGCHVCLDGLTLDVECITVHADARLILIDCEVQSHSIEVSGGLKLLRASVVGCESHGVVCRAGGVLKCEKSCVRECVGLGLWIR